MYGMIAGPGPLCEQQMPQWIIQVALLQTYITRLRTGDQAITVCQANPGLRGCEAWEVASRSGEVNPAAAE
jgi:hypothetical protein